jgi:hypothetical protein
MTVRSMTVPRAIVHKKLPPVSKLPQQEPHDAAAPVVAAAGAVEEAAAESRPSLKHSPRLP